MEQENVTEQPSQDSVQDRIADIFSTGEQPQETQAAPTQETAETAEETFELEHEGRRFTLPKVLEKGFSQEKDYTQKSQTLAEMRKDVERQFAQIKLQQTEAQFAQSIKAENDQIGIVDAALAEFGKLDWQSMSTDDLIRNRLKIDQFKEYKAALENNVKAKRAQFEQTYTQELDRLKGEAKETLRKRINWTDETETEVRAYAKELGLLDAEYDAVFDPRHKQILWEAAQYRKAKTKATPAVQQVKAVKTTSSSPMPQQVKDRFAFNKAVAKTQPNSPERRKAIEVRAAQIFG